MKIMMNLFWNGWRISTRICSGKTDELEEAVMKLQDTEDVETESYMIRDAVLGKMGELRAACDEAEAITAKKYWPFPTYGDLLFGVK